MKPFSVKKWLVPGLFTGLLIFIAVIAHPLQSATAQKDNDLTGKLLVATPEMQDPRFAESVIYIVKHDREGSLGLVINRPLANAPIEEVLKGFGIESNGAKGEMAVHYGGPVSARQGFVLHTDDVVLETSTKVKDGIAMSSDVEMIRDISQGKGPRQFLLMIGYAGWAPGQLEGEIQAKAWFAIAADKEIIFGKEAEKKWQRAMDKRQVPL